MSHCVSLCLTLYQRRHFSAFSLCLTLAPKTTVKTPKIYPIFFCTKIAKITWNNKEQLRTLNTTKALKMRALVIVYSNCSKLLIINHLPTQKCVKIFPKISLGTILPWPVMSARSSRTRRKSSEMRSPLRPDSKPDNTRDRFSWALTSGWY